MAVALVAISAALTPPGSAGTPLGSAGTAQSATSAAPHAATQVCQVRDSRARELSGLVATRTGFVTINDSQFDPDAMGVFFLDSRCAVTKVVHYPTAARDPEDLAVAPDGTLWVADIGDNINSDSRRQTVALWHLTTSGKPVIHRLRYPDGPHDAEALLFATDGTPIVITKELAGRAGLYQASDRLVAGSADGVPMRRVGTFTPSATGENSPFGALGEVLVTGAATAPDRRRVALRTYTAAYEWDVPDGDVVKAITTTVPRVTALPDEPQGEAIAYTVDGSAYLTVNDEPGPTAVRRYPLSTMNMVTVPSSSPGQRPYARPGQKTLFSDIPASYAIAAALSGLMLVAAGLFGVRRARRRN